jgi:hypothetical protein
VGHIYSGSFTAGFAGTAIASGRAPLIPIRWEEPFGMVMVEALA